MIPEHDVLPPEQVIAIIAREVQPAFTGSVHVCDDRRPIDRDDPRRRTLVPFFKICLEGYFLLPACDARPALRIEPGDALLFHADSYANDVFPVSCRFFRVTVHSDQAMIGVEQIRRRGGSRQSLVAAHCCLQPLGPCGLAVLAALAAAEGDAVSSARMNLVRVFLDQLILLLRKTPPQEGAADRRYAAIMNFLQEHCGDPIGRDDVARALGMSPSHVSRLCRDHGRRGFNEELNALRLELARELLQRSELSIDDLARRSGFSGGNYFAQVFKATHGCSPSAWRRHR